MAELSPFLVRDAETSEDDFEFVLSTYDAALPFLDSIGNTAQWGLVPFSQRGDFPQTTRSDLHHSEEYRLNGTSSENGLRVFIVEREYFEESFGEYPFKLRVAVDGRRFLPVGFAYVRENWVPSYVKSQPNLQIPKTELGDFIYLEVIVTDSRVGNLSRGAGAALISGIRNYGRSRHKKELWLDSWAGNERKLVKYYEKQGFQTIGDWSHTRINKAPWMGTLMQIEIQGP